MSREKILEWLAVRPHLSSFSKWFIKTKHESLTDAIEALIASQDLEMYRRCSLLIADYLYDLCHDRLIDYCANAVYGSHRMYLNYTEDHYSSKRTKEEIVDMKYRASHAASAAFLLAHVAMSKNPIFNAAKLTWRCAKSFPHAVEDVICKMTLGDIFVVGLKHIREALSEKENAICIDYDPGLLNDNGGGNVSWWHDYIRNEVSRCNEYWKNHVEAVKERSMSISERTKKLHKMFEEA